jgi:hypothetical protein
MNEIDPVGGSFRCDYPRGYAHVLVRPRIEFMVPLRRILRPVHHSHHPHVIPMHKNNL